MRDFAVSPAAVLAIVCGLGISGCDDRQPLAPGEPAPLEPASHGNAASSGFSASYGIPVPPQNEPDNGAVHPFQVMTKDSIWVRIRVDGQVSVSEHPRYMDLCHAGDWKPCPPPYSGKQVGPEGLVVPDQSGPALGVTVRIQASKYTQNVYFDADGGTGNVQYVWVAKGAVMMVQRNGIPASRICLSETCTAGSIKWSGLVPYYDLGGTQTLRIEEVPVPLRVRGPSWVAPGDTATFTAELDMPLSPIRWYFLRGDTSAVPRNPSTLDWDATIIRACSNSLTCRYAPPVGGRVYVSGAAYGLYSAQAFSDVVRVGAGRLVLECNSTRGSVSVRRGNMIDCTAKTEPAGVDWHVTKWSFSGGGQKVTEKSTAPEWGGPMVVSGSVTVGGVVGGEEQTASVEVKVVPRDWSGQAIPFQVIDENPSSLPTRPTKPIEIGQFEPRPIFLDRSAAIEEISKGPNRGFTYLTSIPFQTQGIVRVNRVALSVGSDFWQLQPARAIPPQCSRNDVAPFVGLVLAHEGIPVNRKSHAGLFKEVLDKKGGGPFEKIVEYGSRDATYLKAYDTFVSIYKAAAANDDNADSLYPVQYCNFRYF